MNEWLLRLALAGILGTTFPLIGAEPNSATSGHRQVLIEFVVLEIDGGASRPLALPGIGAVSNAPKEMHLGGFSSAAHVDRDLESTLAALVQDARVRVLQRPRIQTCDQTPATLCVGQASPDEPQTVSAGEPLMLGLTLAVTPFIHSNGVITLDLNMKQVARDGSVQTRTGLAPVTTTREALAKIAVRDRETILLAGLVKPAAQNPVPSFRSPKDSLGARASGALARGRSRLSETLLLVRPTLVHQS